MGRRSSPASSEVAFANVDCVKRAIDGFVLHIKVLGTLGAAVHLKIVADRCVLLYSKSVRISSGVGPAARYL